MITDYSNRPMVGITEDEYETLSLHLQEQLLALYCVDMDDPDAREADAKHVGHVLNASWSDGITARKWLRLAGDVLRVDTTNCVGA